MSWTVQPLTGTIDEIVNALPATKLHENQACPEESAAQLEIAKNAAVGLIASGALGDPTTEQRFVVTLSGHANEGHEPVVGVANDCITVTVAQLSEGAP